MTSTPRSCSMTSSSTRSGFTTSNSSRAWARPWRSAPGSPRASGPRSAPRRSCPRPRRAARWGRGAHCSAPAASQRAALSPSGTLAHRALILPPWTRPPGRAGRPHVNVEHALARLDPDLATVVRDDVADDGQAQPGAPVSRLRGGRHGRSARRCARGRRDADPPVADRHVDPGPVRATATSTLPPGSLYFTALSSRLVTAETAGAGRPPR